MTDKTRKRLYNWLKLILSATCGFVVTYTLLTWGPRLDFKLWIFYEYDVLFASICLLCLLLTLWSFLSLKRLSRLRAESNQEEELEGQISAKEWVVSKLNIISTFNIIFSFVWLALSLGLVAQGSEGQYFFSMLNIVLSVLFVLMTIMLQNRTLRHFNHVYPDRQLDLDSSKGQNDLFEKLDEGEKWIVYQSAYKTFRYIDHLLMVGIVILVGYSFLISFSPVPILVLALIWVAIKGIYFREATKFYRAKN